RAQGVTPHGSDGASPYQLLKKEGRPSGRPSRIRLIQNLGQDFLRNVDRLLLLAQGPTQLGQRDILQLPDSLSRDTEFLADFFESFRFATVQPESLEDNLSLTVVQHLQKLADFVAQVLVSEQLKRRLRIFVTDDLAKFGRVIVANRRIKR